MSEPAAKKDSPAWREALDIAGSIASVTGISLLVLRKAAGGLRAGEILAWIVASCLLLAAGTAMVEGCLSLSKKVRGARGLAIYWLTAAPAAIIAGIFLVQLARELLVPFVIVLVYGSYP